MDNPLDIIDRTVSSYTGGINTDKYYAQIYANQVNGVPTETLVIEPSAAQQTVGTAGQHVNDQQPAPQNTPQPGVGDSPIDVFLRTTTSGDQVAPIPSATTTAPTQVPITSTQPQYTQTVAATPKVSVTPTGAFGFIVSAAFSIAVVISVIGIMFVVYIIIRTRQLHHHEDHVKELGGHGDGHGAHGDAKDAAHHAATADVHVADDTHADTQTDAHDEHSDAEDAVELHEDPAEASEVDDTAPIQPVASLTGDEASQYGSRLKTIKADAEGDDEDAWYTALMDVNLLLEDVLGEKGYEGTTVKEMLQDDETKILATRDVALEAEAEFQKLISGESPLTKDAIVSLVNMYAKVCKELGVV
jgi:hypothetical protein